MKQPFTSKRPSREGRFALRRIICNIIKSVNKKGTAISNITISSALTEATSFT